MKVKILVEADYSDFETKRGFVIAQHLTPGAVVEFPDWYAQDIIKSKLAVDFNEAVIQQLIPEPVETEPAKKRGRNK